MPLLETRGAASVQGFGSLAASARNYIEDVFSTYLYTGNGSTQTITNGIDLSGKGGLVWIKSRNVAGTAQFFQDTVRGANNFLDSTTTGANQSIPTANTSFTSTGFSQNNAFTSLNESPNTYASWTFRKQAKFFDVVTYTGNGTAGRAISHNLGSAPGCIIVKSTSLGDDWYVWHRSYPSGNGFMTLNFTGAIQNSGTNYFTSTSSDFTISQSSVGNINGATYVAYLFAHDAGGFGASGSDNVISCGSYTGSNSVPASVNLGWEPQWVLIKGASGTAANNNWVMYDVMRGMPTGSAAERIWPNLSGAASVATQICPTATGFRIDSVGTAEINFDATTYIYIAIRRGPMKTPTTGTSVFVPQILPANSASTTTPVNVGLTTDMVFGSHLSDESGGKFFASRLTADYRLNSTSTAAEALGAYYWDNMVGVRQQETNQQPTWYFLRRAPGFFDVVCYTGNSTAGRTIQHNLGAVPELIIVKARNLAENWYVYSTPLGNTKSVQLNQTNAQNAGSVTYWNSTNPTSSVFTLGANAEVNGAYDYVAYLFATCPGVSKVGSYTGTGSVLQINCGFTGGARFVLIKATSTTGDWLVWDSARGIVAGNDPYLALNSTAAEVTTTDWVDTHSPGFELSNAVGNLANTNGTSYIFLAVA